MSENIMSKLTKAKARLVNQQPFFAHIVLSTPIVIADWLKPKTMATDMKYIYAHPEFVEKCSIAELVGVLAHEAMHIAYLHGLRLGTRDPRIWNYAADLVINPIVLDAGMALPPGGLFDKKYKDWTAEAVYADLIKNATKINVSFPSNGDGGDGDGDGEPMWGGVMQPQQTDGKEGEERPNGKPLSGAEMTQIEQEIRVKVQAAANIAKSRGNLPAGLKGLIEAHGKPKINWKEYIQNWVSGHTPDDYTWQRPNRTILANYGIYMPRMKNNGAGVGVLSIDTSGSVSDGELRDYVREIVGVIEICSPEKLYIIQHDAVIQKVDIWEAGMDFSSLAVKGRGGTFIQPTFKKVSELEEPIDWMICFTDMGIGDYPKDAPDYPVLWAATGPDNAPFGTYVPVKDAI